MKSASEVNSDYECIDASGEHPTIVSLPDGLVDSQDYPDCIAVAC